MAQDIAAPLEIAIQIASASVEAHHAGIIHRDLKPDDVIIRPTAVYFSPASHREPAQLDVCWLQFAMHDAVIVGGFERLCDLSAIDDASSSGSGPWTSRSARVIPSMSSSTSADVLDDAGLPGPWRIPGDLHPNAPTARKIAMAIADRLRDTPASASTRD